ncbi:acyltransferase [Fulvivirga ulvae]|uniref:acyltransferase family protein n=1 Tax=Fulvivirga ulvae TaxID=2904245 RepID=UPI001F3F78C7|nr:acyltransferase [Fulvivirga ulvae]UII30972.1 acyltransferase [Fulvivirga ulvae]
MSKKEGYLNYIHLFRGFAILIIVGIHCRISFRWPKDSIFRDVFITLLDNGTVLFVFIAGFLFQYLKGKYEYSSYLKRKTKYVILPYLIASTPAIIIDLYSKIPPVWLPENLVDQPKIFQALYMIATGKHLGPFWFIPMIVIFYLISPLLLRIDRPGFYKFIFPVLFIAGLFTYRFGFFSNTIDSFIHYLPVYIFGMGAARYRKELINLKTSWAILLVIIYCTIATLEVINIIAIPKLSSFEVARTAPYFAFNFSKLKVSLLCIILLRGFYVLNRDSLILKALGDYSFGIYFVHLYVITACEMVMKLIQPDFKLGPLTFLFYTALVSGLSIMIVIAIKKVFPRYSRLLIGS